MGAALLVAAAASAFLTFTGAFGVTEAAPAQRAAYWLGLLLLGAAAAWAIRRSLRRARGISERPWLLLIAQSMILALILTGVVAVATEFAFGGRHGFSDLQAYFFPVLIVTLTVSAVSRLAQGRVAVRAGSAAAAPPRFLMRLPPRLRAAEIYALEAEDHYLRVHTSAGSDLVLMRLSDAVGELDGLDGAQTHRSWWVARSAVREARPQFGRAVLTLPGGVEARVSRRYAKGLRRAGWY